MKEMNYYQVKEEVIQGKKEEAVKVAVTIDDNVNYVDLDDYLLGVVAGEMPANFELEALKAQVVASRTFVYNRNLSVDNTVNSQVYLSEDEMKKNWGDKYNEYHHYFFLLVMAIQKMLKIILNLVPYLI